MKNFILFCVLCCVQMPLTSCWLEPVSEKNKFPFAWECYNKAEYFATYATVWFSTDPNVPIFSPDLWANFSIEYISDPKLKEVMNAIFTYRKQAKEYILEAERLRNAIPDKMVRDAIAGAISAAVVAVNGGLRTTLIAAAVGAFSNITINFVYNYYEILDALNNAKIASEKADILEKYVLVNATLPR